MNNTQILLLTVVLLFAPIVHQAQSKSDTVVVNFGNSSKMIFYINEKGDLKALESYDLNAIVTDMKNKIEADTATNANEDGDKYLKDSLMNVEARVNTIENDTIVDNYSYNNDDNHWNNDDDDDDDDWDNGYDNWRNRKGRNNDVYINKKFGDNHYINFDFGINNYLEDGVSPSNGNAQHTVKPWGSWYFAINSVQDNYISKSLSIEASLGISWYNFKFEDASTRLIKSNDPAQLDFIGSPDGDSFKKSKLTASFINIGLVPVLNLGRKRNGFKIGAGVYGGYRLGSHVKYQYKLDGKSEKDKDRDNFHLNNWRYGARLQLRLMNTDFFVNYDMNELFSEGTAPNLNAISFGVTF